MRIYNEGEKIILDFEGAFLINVDPKSVVGIKDDIEGKHHLEVRSANLMKLHVSQEIYENHMKHHKDFINCRSVIFSRNEGNQIKIWVGEQKE